jgi:hypothetical protein
MQGLGSRRQENTAAARVVGNRDPGLQHLG